MRRLLLSACLHVGATAMRADSPLQTDVHVLAPDQKEKLVCSSIVDSLDNSWCEANCATAPDTTLCGAACKCSTRKPKAEVHNETEAAEPGCRSHSDTVSDEWCDQTCTSTPDSDDCVASCRCPGWGKNHAAARKQKEKKEWRKAGHCTPLADTVSGDWCDGSCLNTPNAVQCRDTCDCPGRKKSQPVVDPSPLPAVCKSKVDTVSDEWCDQTCIKTPNDKSCTATCHCPGWTKALKEVDGPKAAVCRSIVAQVPAAWCDDNCRSTPDVDGCKAACECPAVAPSPSPKPGEATTCKSIVDTATGAWCDENCEKDPNAEWCDPACRCPGFNATLAAERLAKKGHNCTGIIDTASGNWCDENCQLNPDTPQCSKLCICSDSKVQPSPASSPAICESITSTADSDWCDQNCLAQPKTDSCKAACKCPPAPKPKLATAVSEKPHSWLHFLQYEQIRLM